MPSISITSPGTPERTADLAAHNTLGRLQDNTIQILDGIVSKHHCHIDEDSGRFVLRDLGSRNGTFVNGERVSSARVLSPGDEVTLGSTTIVFDAEAARANRWGSAAAASAVGHVTMSDGVVESHVQARLVPQTDQSFVAERLLTDVPALRRDYEKLRVSFELTRAIAGELDVDRLLEKILDAAFGLLPADRGVVLLLDHAGTPQPRCVRTKRGEPTEVALSSTIVETVLRERAAVSSSDARVDARFKEAQSVIAQGIRSSMAVPLIGNGNLLGLMVLDSRCVADAFTEKDLQLTQAFANQAAMAIQNGLFAAKLEQEALTRLRFQRLLSPAIAELVVSGEVEVQKGGRSRNATVFFSDIRGFTAMSERRSAQDIVDMLNEYFEVMVEIVFKHEGTLDKFVGDEIMALFGAPVAHEDDPHRAVRVAVEQMRALDEWNRVRAANGEEAIQIGIGINTGEVVVGYLGSSKALEYTVIGDVVNTASRLCNAAKAGEILITRSTYEIIKDAFEAEALPAVQVKNKEQALQIYRVTGERSPAPGDVDATLAVRRPV